MSVNSAVSETIWLPTATYVPSGGTEAEKGQNARASEIVLSYSHVCVGSEHRPNVA